eukprot:1952065-Amphidinium_carterae.1
MVRSHPLVLGALIACASSLPSSSFYDAFANASLLTLCALVVCMLASVRQVHVIEKQSNVFLFITQNGVHTLPVLEL